MLDVSKLALLREVSIHGSITAAANSMQTSASNISQRLQRLESETGIKLLATAGRGVTLTPQARKLVAHTERILAVLEEAEAEISRVKETPSGTVHLIAFHTFAIGMLANTAHHLKKISPEITLKFTQLDPDSAITELLARRADIIVADEYPGIPLKPNAGLYRENLGRESIKTFLPEDINDPAKASWALEPAGTPTHEWAMSICQTEGFTPEVLFSSPDPYVHKKLLTQGVAAAFLPAGTAQDINLQEHSLSSRSESRMYRELLTLVRSGAERSPTVAACRKALEAAFYDFSEGFKKSGSN